MPISTTQLRTQLKGGVAGPLYRLLRGWKRRLRREPTLGNVPIVVRPLSLESLLPLADAFAGESRYHFSLALAYLDAQPAPDYANALTALQAAESLQFESPERVALYTALCLAEMGQPDGAQSLVQSLLPGELTDEENALRDRLLVSTSPPA